LREQGLDEEAAAVLTHKQTISAYYFAPRGPNGQPTFAFWVALDQGTINSLLTVSRTVCSAIDRKGAASLFKKNIKDALEDKTGESFDSVAEGVQKGLFIPVSHLSPWLTKSWPDTEREIEEASAQDLEKYKKDFCKKSTQL
jgi:hypothetical protein